MEILSASIEFLQMKNVWDCLELTNNWMMIQARFLRDYRCSIDNKKYLRSKEL